MTGRLDRKDDPVNSEMIEWLWAHPEKRAEIWKEIRNDAHSEKI